MIKVVAGITRSGLTATMQMLSAGGYPCFGGWPAFEQYALGNLPWAECSGKAVKLVDTQLQWPPEGEYQVIRLARNLQHQADSLNKWNEVFGIPRVPRETYVRSLVRDYAAIDKWAEQQSRRTIVHFSDIIEKPRSVAQFLSGWLGADLDVERMAGVIVPRAIGCHPGLLELSMTDEYQA